MVSTCPNCGSPLRPGARFCGVCGAPASVVLTGASVPSPGAPDPKNGVCANGHPQIRSNARFCYVCGAPVNPSGATGPIFNNRYQVVAKIGEGGMGSVVYKVLDLQSPGHWLALKEIDEMSLQPPDDRPELVKAFQREAELLRQLDHPNIVKVRDSFQIGAKHYMVMDLVQGRTLDKMLEASPGGFPEVRVLSWAEQLCSALDYLHHLTPPIIYRDMKPGNVMVEDGTGQIKVIDFGIAREYKGGKKKHDTVRFGTPGYTPPEQYGQAGSETRPASDVYALGTMLYQLLTGADPTSRPLSFFNKIELTRPPASVSLHVADALERAVELDMKKRFQGMAEFREALTGAVVSESPQSRPPRRKRPASYTPPSLTSPRSTGPVHVSPDHLDAGRVEKGAVAPSLAFSVSLTGSGKAHVTAQEDWLIASPTSAGHGESVEIMVISDALALGKKTWTAPNLFVLLVSRMRNLSQGAGWIIGLILLLILIWSVARQGLVLVVGGALAIQLSIWLVAWLLPHVIATPLAHTGHIGVETSSHSATVVVEVTVVPSAGRRMIGWAALLGLIAFELTVIGSLIGSLVQALGG